MIAWWIEKPIILASSCPTDRQLLMLYREGFRVIISLIDEREEPPLYDRKTANDIGFVRHNIPVAEGRLPTQRQIERFDRLACSVNHDQRIIVHCLSGDKRTGAMAMAWWMSRGMSEEEARKEVNIRRKEATNINWQYLPGVVIPKKEGNGNSDTQKLREIAGK
ncbi:MAG: dual specificity protein phosphatase family protein [Syntrophaceae bacterium]|nr:dual specificity protein phosphatase family protein [Syntrophaceae bacterium]